MVIQLVPEMCLLTVNTANQRSNSWWFFNS